MNDQTSLKGAVIKDKRMIMYLAMKVGGARAMAVNPFSIDLACVEIDNFFEKHKDGITKKEYHKMLADSRKRRFFD